MGHKPLRSLSGMQIQVLSGKDRNIWDHLRKFWNTSGHLGIQHQSTETFQGEFLQDSNQWPEARPALPSPSSNLKRKENKLSTATSSAARYSITATRRW